MPIHTIFYSKTLPPLTYKRVYTVYETPPPKTTKNKYDLYTMHWKIKTKGHHFL